MGVALDDVRWRPDDTGQLRPWVQSKRRFAGWAPQPGSQQAFLNTAGVVFEVLFSGERGPGKTDALLMDFAQDVGRGWGADWKGVLFRRTYPELKDVIDKSKKWFPLLFPGAKYNGQDHVWTFPTGEQLLFRNFMKPSDYYAYHGHAYPWIAWEELTTWPDDAGYKLMFSCARSSRFGVPIRVRATTNPYGVGHNWVKARFRLQGCPSSSQTMTKIIRDARDFEGNVEEPRCTVFGRLNENRVLIHADPGYIARVLSAARNDMERKAWSIGTWDIVAGGIFSEVWDPTQHIVQPFNIPHSWRIDRSFDYGSSAPFSVIWWAESDGSDYQDSKGAWRSSVRRDLYGIREWYGFTGKPNEGLRYTLSQMSEGIVERQLLWNLHGRVQAGPADTSIFDEENGTSFAREMEKPVRIKGKEYNGVTWTRADKRAGSRKLGWQAVAQRMADAKKREGRVREKPGLFVFDSLDQWIRTVPILPRDEKDLDDVDTNAEDHAGDATRYRVTAGGAIATGGSTTGMH